MSIERSIKSDRGSIDDNIIEDTDPDGVDIDIDIDIDVGVDPIDIESYDHKPELGSIEEEGEEPMLTAGGDRKRGVATVDCGFFDGGSNQGEDTSTNEDSLMHARGGKQRVRIGCEEKNEKAPMIDYTLDGDTTSASEIRPMDSKQESNEETIIADIDDESSIGGNEQLLPESEQTPSHQALGLSDEELMALALRIQQMKEMQNDSRGIDQGQEVIPCKFEHHRLEFLKQQQQKTELQGAIEELNMEANKQEEKIKLLRREAETLNYGHNYQSLEFKQQQLQYQLQQQQQQQQQHNRQVQFLMAQKQAFLQRQFQHERCGAQQIGYNAIYDPMMANPQGLWPGTYALGNPDTRAGSPEATTLPLAMSNSSSPMANSTAAHAATQQLARIEHLQMLKRSKEDAVRISLQKLNRLTQEIQRMEQFAFESTPTSNKTEEEQIREINGDPPVCRIHATKKNDPLRQKPNSTDAKVQKPEETGSDTPDSERKKRTKKKQEIEALTNENKTTENNSSAGIPIQEHRPPKPPVEHQTLQLETGLPLDGLDSFFRNLKKRNGYTSNPCNQHLSRDEEPQNFAVAGPSNDDDKPELDRIRGSDNANCDDLQKMRKISSSPQRLEEIADQRVQQLQLEVEAILKRMERSCRDDNGIDNNNTSKKGKPVPDSPEEATPDSLRDYVTSLTTGMNEENLNSPNTSIQSFSPAPSDSKNRLGENFPAYPSDLENGLVIAGDNSSVDSNCKKDLDEVMLSNSFVDPFSPQQDLILSSPRAIPLSSMSSDEIFSTYIKGEDLAAQAPMMEPPPSNSNTRPESAFGAIKTLPENHLRKQESYEKQSSCTKPIAARSSNVQKLSAKKPSTKKKSPHVRRVKTPTKKQNDKWMAYYRLLILYKHEQNGSTDVPRHYKDKKLGCWVKHQRDKYRLGVVLPERVRLLDELGFHWTVRTRWNDMFQQLVEYKHRFGDTRVLEKREELLTMEKDERNRSGASPAAPSSPLPPLRLWVFRQRYMYKWGKLTEQRIKKLNGIGFQWDGNKVDNKDQQRFEEKLEFRQHLLQRSDAGAESQPPDPVRDRGPPKRRTL